MTLAKTFIIFSTYTNRVMPLAKALWLKINFHLQDFHSSNEPHDQHAAIQASTLDLQ